MSVDGKLDLTDYTLNPKYPLTKEQQDGVRFLVKRRRAILSFQTGLGKTYTSLTSFFHLYRLQKKFRCVVICPVNAVLAFEEELKHKFNLSDDRIGWFTTDKVEYDLDNNIVFLFTFTALENYWHKLEEIKKRGYLMVSIIDEAHKLQAKDTNIKLRLEQLKQYFDVGWLSTATPLLNDIEGMINLVEYYFPRFFGTRSAFYNKYTVYKLETVYIRGGGGKKRKVRNILGYKNLEELRSRLEEICITRQRHYDITFGCFGGELGNEEAELYEKASAGILQNEERTFGARLHDLQRVVDSSYYSDMDLSYSSKERLLLKFLKEVVRRDNPVVIYAEHRSTIDRLNKILNAFKENGEVNWRNLFLITGGVSIEERKRIREVVGERDIILMSSAGSQSLNLEKVNCLLFYDIAFSVGIMIQVIGRITRLSTKHNKLYVAMIYMKDTIDEYKYVLFNDNAYLIKQLFGGESLPVDLKLLDKKNMKALKDRFLWHYKGGDKKEKRKNKRMVNNNLICCSGDEYKELIAEYYIDLNPINLDVKHSTKRLDVLCPNKDAYDLLVSSPKLKPVFISKYLESLKSKESVKVIQVLINTLIQKKSVVLVDDYGVGEVLKKHILETYFN